MERNENIDYCIRYLMEQEGVESEIPVSLKEKQLLLRALMNVWEPQPLSDKYIKAQDAELKAQLLDKGVVENTGTLWQGDITRLKVDAIVNAANSRGLGCWHPLHSCIDNAIHSAAGLQLRQECDNILQGSELATRKAIITAGYNLPCRYVIHTFGPIVPNGIPTPEQEWQLAECYRSCLRLAADHGCRTIAFCCISTGEFRFPNRRAAEIAIECVNTTINNPLSQTHNSTIKVVFNVFKDIDYDIYSELLRTY